MLKENHYIEIKLSGRTVGRYKKLGYKGEYGDTIYINQKDLPSNSHTDTVRICDNCGEEYTRSNMHANKTFKIWGEDLCCDCLKSSKYKQAKRDKVEQTNLLKYGGKAPLCSAKIREKQQDTMENKYGARFAAQVEDFKQKQKETMVERYGKENPGQIEQFQEKRINTLSQHGEVWTSKQQVAIFLILKEHGFNPVLNKPLGKYALDIVIDNICVEYDAAYWHNEDYDKQRDAYTISNGYKVLRIKSGHKLPDIQLLLNTIHTLKNSDETYVEIVLSDWDK